MFQKINDIVTRIKQARPVILNITNNVTMDMIANGLLSLGASPIMSNTEKECQELVAIASAVVINLGTLDDVFMRQCASVCEVANQLNKPIILDPVGAGASRYRTDSSLYLMNHFDIAIIRGNASEVMALAGDAATTKGVDSGVQCDVAMGSAKLLATKYDAVIVVSGETDLIVDKENSLQLSFGSPLMPMITGTGCLLSAVTGAFHSIEKNAFPAALYATAFYGRCGENAGKKAQGPASFKVKFIDELSYMPEVVQ